MLDPPAATSLCVDLAGCCFLSPDLAGRSSQPSGHGSTAAGPRASSATGAIVVGCMRSGGGGAGPHVPHRRRRDPGLTRRRRRRRGPVPAPVPPLALTEREGRAEREAERESWKETLSPHIYISPVECLIRALPRLQKYLQRRAF
jgi:hypothetical protein